MKGTGRNKDFTLPESNCGQGSGGLRVGRRIEMGNGLKKYWRLLPKRTLRSLPHGLHLNEIFFKLNRYNIKGSVLLWQLISIEKFEKAEWSMKGEKPIDEFAKV